MNVLHRFAPVVKLHVPESHPSQPFNLSDSECDVVRIIHLTFIVDFEMRKP